MGRVGFYTQTHTTHREVSFYTQTHTTLGEGQLLHTQTHNAWGGQLLHTDTHNAWGGQLLHTDSCQPRFFGFRKACIVTLTKKGDFYVPPHPHLNNNYGPG